MKHFQNEGSTRIHIILILQTEFQKNHLEEKMDQNSDTGGS